MPLPVIAGVVRAAVSGKVPSAQNWTNVWHFRYSGGASSPGPTDITALDALFTRVYSGTAFGGGFPWLTKCGSAVTLTKISYVILDGSALGQDVAKSLLGTGGATSVPSECSPVLTLRSNQRGRSHRGRVYLPPFLQANLTADGRLNSTAATDFINQVNGFKTALGGALVSPFWEMGIASYKLSVFTPLASATMDLDVDVQRRRKN